VLSVPSSYDHLSAISAITPDGHLYFQVQETAYTSADVVAFLKNLHSQIPGKLLVIWDRAPIHRGQPIKDYLAGGAAKYLQLEQLPAYAPELNPDEGIWSYLKGVELKNVCNTDLNQLLSRLKQAVRRLRRKPQVIIGCVKEAGLAV
jgi:transposase